MQQAQIPSVLPLAVLDDYHRRHIGPTPASHRALPDDYVPAAAHQPEHAHVEEAEAGGLGLLPDGTPRTITDGEIAVLRFSEIQRLLRERRHKRAAAAEESEEPVNVKSRPRRQRYPRRNLTMRKTNTSSPRQASRNGETQPSSQPSASKSGGTTVPPEEGDGQRPGSASQRSKAAPGIWSSFAGDPNDPWRARRAARELDTPPAQEDPVELDY